MGTESGAVNNTIFGKIIRQEIPVERVYEDDQALAFRDINPQAPVHLLVIPKEHIESLATIAPEQQALMGHLMGVIQQVATEAGLTDGYRVVTNIGSDGGQTVPHLHFHILGGRGLGWPPG